MTSIEPLALRAHPVAAVPRKYGKFGAAKYVYPKPTMSELRSWFDAELAATLPVARSLFWT